MSLTRILYLLILWSWSSQSVGMSDIEITRTMKQLNLAKSVEYLEDFQGDFSLESVVNGSTQHQWLPNQQNIINFGYTDTVYWFRFSIMNRTEREIKRLLNIGQPLLDRVDIYTNPLQESATHIRLGDQYVFSERLIVHREFLIPIVLQPEQVKVFYLRIQSQSSMQVPLFLWEENTFLENEQQVTIGLGIYFGIMISMIFYNLFLYISIRDKNYLIYIFSVSVTALVQAALKGYSFQYLWPGSPAFQHYHMPFIVSFSGGSVALLSLYFLELKKHSPWISNMTVGFITILMLNALFSPLTGYHFSLRVGVGFTMLYSLLGLYSGAYMMKKGFEPAKYFCLAYISLFAGASLIALSKFGYIPRNVITENAQEVGSSLEVILLSFALAYRVAVLRQEKQKAQLNAAAELERKVYERTEKLNDAMKQLAVVNHQLSKQNKEDGLTGALNRRCFNETLEEEWQRAKRTGVPLTLVMADVDHFKAFNDNYGHLVGDGCLRLVSQCIQKSVQRASDFVFRYGGEEFAILFANTDFNEAWMAVEKIQANLKKQKLDIQDQQVSVTISFGVSCLMPRESQESKLLIAKADKALYMAKEQGRDRIVGFNLDKLIQEKEERID